MQHRRFVSLYTFKKVSKHLGLRVKKVTVAKEHNYFQAISKPDGIVGMFLETRKDGVNTGRGRGHLGSED
jgi:hypothetical protein